MHGSISAGSEYEVPYRNGSCRTFNMRVQLASSMSFAEPRRLSRSMINHLPFYSPCISAACITRFVCIMLCDVMRYSQVLPAA